MLYCPNTNCLQKLPADDLASCPKCGADFGLSSTWQPTLIPNTPPEAPSVVSLVVKLLLLVGIFLILIALVLY